jgi:hypothetical protein
VSFIERFGAEYQRPITPRYVGHLIRNRLRLYTYKRHGSFVLPLGQEEHFTVLAARYGLTPGGEGDMGTLEMGDHDGNPRFLLALRSRLGSTIEACSALRRWQSDL